MIIRDTIESVIISLKIQKGCFWLPWTRSYDQHLFIMMERSGGINRVGPVDPHDAQKPAFCIGAGQESLFHSFMELVPDDWFRVFDPTLPRGFKGFVIKGERVGELCSLEITFTEKDRPATIAFAYGAKSEGPPQVVCDLIQKAVELTEPWYAESQALSNRGTPSSQ